MLKITKVNIFMLLNIYYLMIAIILNFVNTTVVYNAKTFNIYDLYILKKLNLFANTCCG